LSKRVADAYELGQATCTQTKCLGDTYVRAAVQYVYLVYLRYPRCSNSLVVWGHDPWDNWRYLTVSIAHARYYWISLQRVATKVMPG